MFPAPASFPVGLNEILVMVVVQFRTGLTGVQKVPRPFPLLKTSKDCGLLNATGGDEKGPFSVFRAAMDEGKKTSHCKSRRNPQKREKKAGCLRIKEEE